MFFKFSSPHVTLRPSYIRYTFQSLNKPNEIHAVGRGGHMAIATLSPTSHKLQSQSCFSSCWLGFAASAAFLGNLFISPRDISPLFFFSFVFVLDRLVLPWILSTPHIESSVDLSPTLLCRFYPLQVKMSGTTRVLERTKYTFRCQVNDLRSR